MVCRNACYSVLPLFARTGLSQGQTPLLWNRLFNGSWLFDHGAVALDDIKLSPPWYYREQTDLCDRQIRSRHLLSGGSGSVEHLLMARPLCIGL